MKTNFTFNLIAVCLTSTCLWAADIQASQETKASEQSMAIQSQAPNPSGEQRVASNSPEEMKAALPEFTGRLPRYYATVVDDSQRQAIYALQAEFFQKKRAIQEQLEALEKAELSAIESLVTTDQLKHIRDLTEQAKQRFLQSRTNANAADQSDPKVTKQPTSK